MEMIRSIREASTRSDFVQLMDKGLKTKMLDAYNQQESEYEKLVSFEDSTSDKESYPGIGGVPMPEKVLEKEAFKAIDAFGTQSIDLTNYKYGSIIEITREAVDDDQTKKIKDLPNKMGQGHKNYENQSFFSALVGGETAATCYDTLAIFTTNHYDRKSGTARANNDNLYTSASLTAGSLITAMSMIDLWSGLNNEKITVMGKKVVIPSRLAFAANWLIKGAGIPAFASTAGVTGAASAQGQTVGQNPAATTFNLDVFVSKWIPKISGVSLSDWYIFTDVPGWVWQWRDKLEMYAEGNLSTSWFERDVMRWKSRARWANGCLDWRFAIKIT